LCLAPTRGSLGTIPDATLSRPPYRDRMTSQAHLDDVRIVIDLHRVNGDLEGVLTREDTVEQRPFSGWLELLQCLEAIVCQVD
jgi:hypothetical protein